MTRTHRCGLMAGAVLMAASTSPSFASGDTTGTIVSIRAEQSRILVALSVAPAGSRPACAQSNQYTGAVDLTVNWAQSFYAGLLTAQARGTPVRIFGANTCTTGDGNVEDISRIYIMNQ